MRVRIFPEVHREVEGTVPPAGADRRLGTLPTGARPDRSGSGRHARVEGLCDPQALSRTTGWAPRPRGVGGWEAAQPKGAAGSRPRTPSPVHLH